MVNGKIDDASHAHICEEYGAKMKAAGADIEVVTKHGWGHGFEANYSAEYEEHLEAWHECPDYYTEDDGMANKDANIDSSCITYGYHVGGVWYDDDKKSWNYRLVKRWNEFTCNR